MKTCMLFLALVSISLGTPKSCQAQPPQWVRDLANEVFTLEVGQITHWEEKQMTWYQVDGRQDGSDSVSVNTLYVEGVTSSGAKFVGAIPVVDQELSPVGSRAIRGQTCGGECGCQCCKFKKDDYGCFCDSGENCCVDQENNTCNCWCKHTITADE